MGKEADCTRTVEEAIQGLGGLDILVSNAVSHPPALPGFPSHPAQPNVAQRRTSHPEPREHPNTSPGLHPLQRLRRPRRPDNRRLGHLLRGKRARPNPPNEGRFSNLQREPRRRRLHHHFFHRGD